MPTVGNNWNFVNVTSPDNTGPLDEPAISTGLRYARQETRLRDFIRAKQAAGLISEDQAKDLLAANDSLYKDNGLVRERGDQRAIHTAAEMRRLVDTQKQGLEALKDKLLQFHPEMAAEVNRLLSPGREI